MESLEKQVADYLKPLVPFQRVSFYFDLDSIILSSPERGGHVGWGGEGVSDGSGYGGLLECCYFGIESGRGGFLPFEPPCVWAGGFGNKDGSGTGYGEGADDDGYGFSCLPTRGIKEYNGKQVHYIPAHPDVLVIFEHIHGNFAIGRVIQDDLSTRPCYIARMGKCYSIGKNLREAYHSALESYAKSKDE